MQTRTSKDHENRATNELEKHRHKMSFCIRLRTFKVSFAYFCVPCVHLHSSFGKCDARSILELYTIFVYVWYFRHLPNDYMSYYILVAFYNCCRNWLVVAQFRGLKHLYSW